jgi:membrane-associated protein
VEFDLVKLIIAVGYVGVWATIFAESGLLIGFFLPGDTLLLTVGMLAARGQLKLAPLLISLPFAAILGDQLGYLIGRKTGPRIFTRDQSVLFRRENLLAARRFYQKHGGKTVILARFIAFIRTFAPVVAGAAEMPYSKFLLFSLIGGPLWTIGVTLAGYYLGHSIPNLDHYLLVMVILLPSASIISGLLQSARERNKVCKPEGTAE